MCMNPRLNCGGRGCSGGGGVRGAANAEGDGDELCCAGQAPCLWPSCQHGCRPRSWRGWSRSCVTAAERRPLQAASLQAPAPWATRNPTPYRACLCVGVAPRGCRLELSERGGQVARHALPRQQAVPQLAVRLHVTPAEGRDRGAALQGGQATRDEGWGRAASQPANRAKDC